MQPVVWPFVQAHIRRYLPYQHQTCVLGDLLEDFGKQVQQRGRPQAELWLLRESFALSAAYRAHDTRERVHAHLTRATWRTRAMFRLDEITLAVRRLIKQPGASIASILALGCGLAAAATTWAIISATLLSPLPVRSPDTLQVVGLHTDGRDNRPGETSFAHIYSIYPAIIDAGVFDELTAIGSYPSLVREGDRPERRDIYFVRHNFFDVLGIPLAAGTGFRPEDDQRGAPPVAVLSDHYWRTVLAADPHVIGRTIHVNDLATTVIGIAPPSFRGLSLVEVPDFYMPMQALRAYIDPNMNYFMDGSSSSSPTSWLTIIGRVPSADATSRVVSQLNATPLEMLNGKSVAEIGGGSFVVEPVNATAIPSASRDSIRRFTRLLAATVGLLLLIGSLTVGMLLLIRTEQRRDEFAMCLALGASRGRLVSGVVWEGAILAVAGIAASVPLTIWLFAGAAAFELPGGISIDALGLSAGVGTLAASAVAALVSSVLIGLVAGVAGVSANIGDVLRARAGATPRLTRRRLRMSLVGTQVAVTLVLLAGTGLFARSLMSAVGLNPAVDPAHLIQSGINLRAYGYTPQQSDDFWAALDQRLSHNPAISMVTFEQANGGMSGGGKLVIDGEARTVPSYVPNIFVDDRYFPTVNLPIRRGRNFGSEDHANSPRAIIVSESMGRWIANGGDPIGHTVARAAAPDEVARVVGVVPDVVTSVRVLEPLAVYYSLHQPTRIQMITSLSRRITIRPTSTSTLAIDEAMAAIRSIDPQVTPSPFMTAQDRIRLQMGPQQFGVTVLGALGTIALLLTILGTYVLAETMAAVRQREMGIRAALGATRRQLGRLVLGEAVRLVGAGLLVGLGLAWLGSESIRAFLFQVEPMDVTTLTSVCGVILVLALLVSLRPAIRAGRVELSQLLREE